MRFVPDTRLETGLALKPPTTPQATAWLTTGLTDGPISAETRCLRQHTNTGLQIKSLALDSSYADSSHLCLK